MLGGLFPATGLTRQKVYRVTWLRKGYPVQIQQVLDRFGLPTPDYYAALDSGIEEFVVYFGPLVAKRKMLAWFAAVQHDTLAAFSYGVPLHCDSDIRPK